MNGLLGGLQTKHHFLSIKLKGFYDKITEKYVNKTENDYAYLGQEFHPDIKFVHFTHSSNKPHEWKDYEIFK